MSLHMTDIVRNADHLGSMDLTHYSSRARYHLFSKEPDYGLRTFPLECHLYYKKKEATKFFVMVAIDECLSQFTKDLRRITSRDKSMILQMSLRDTLDQKADIWTVTDENIDHLFRICGKEYGHTRLIITI